MQNRINEAGTTATVALSGDVFAAEGDGPLVIPAGKNITLDLNNFNVTAEGSDSFPNLIFVEGTLTIVAGEDTTKNVISMTGEAENANMKTIRLGSESSPGALIVKGGTISNPHRAVQVEYASTFTLEDGTVAGERCSVVLFDDGTFVMEGGSVSVPSGQTAVMALDSSEVSVTGGEIAAGTLGDSSDDSYALYMGDSSSLVIGEDEGSDSDILVTSGCYGVVAFDTASVELKSGTIKAKSMGISGNGTLDNSVTISMSGGTIESDGVGIYMPGLESLEITGGEITAGSGAGVEIRAGDVSISGGTITSNGDPYSADPNGSGSTTVGAAVAVAQHTTKQPITLEITGGTFVGVRALSLSNPQNNDAADIAGVSVSVADGDFKGAVLNDEGGSLGISGGVYDEDPTAYLVEGYGVKQSGGRYVVLPSAEGWTVSEIPDQFYTGFEIKPEMTVTFEGEAVNDSEYDATYDGNVEIGTATVTLTASEDSNYVGSKTVQFKIVSPSYKITWIADRTVTIQHYQFGDTPKYPGGIPKTIVDEDYTYTFLRWFPFISAVDSDITYTAAYVRHENPVPLDVDSEFVYDGLKYKVTSTDPAKVEVIGYESVAESLVIPESVTKHGIEYDVVSIGDKAFYGCGEITSLDLGSVESVGLKSFANCVDLKTVVIPETLKDIGGYAFYGCGLTAVDITGDDVVIGKSAFSACKSMKDVKFSGTGAVIGTNAFYKNNRVATLDLTGVASVGFKAFPYCNGMTKLVIPGEVGVVGGYAFYKCANLKEVLIGEGVTGLDRSAFSGCNAITKIAFPTTLQTVGPNAFYGLSFTDADGNVLSKASELRGHVFSGSDSKLVLVS